MANIIKNMTELTMAGDHTPIFSLAGRRVPAKCTSVYDGDTAYFAFRTDDNSPLFRYKCRMAGYNSAELRTKNQEEKAAAIVARDFLAANILGNIVELEIGKFDMYGRLLVRVIHNNIDINAKMIAGGYGEPYNGRGPKVWKKAK